MECVLIGLDLIDFVIWKGDHEQKYVNNLRMENIIILDFNLLCLS